MAGSAVSLLGDQFTLLALPWLVLRLTGDTVALGTVLALIGIPRAVFILVGGAVVDRFSPQRVLMLTKYVNTVLLALLALGVWQGVLTLPVIYALSLALGISSAFSIPSATSILPHALPPAQLAAANGVMMGLRQLSMFLGPLAAGVLIALFGDGSGGVQDAGGVAVAFGLDALSFALSAWTLSRVVTQPLPANALQHAPIWASVAAGDEVCVSAALHRIEPLLLAGPGRLAPGIWKGGDRWRLAALREEAPAHRARRSARRGGGIVRTVVSMARAESGESR